MTANVKKGYGWFQYVVLGLSAAVLIFFVIVLSSAHNKPRRHAEMKKAFVQARDEAEKKIEKAL